MFARSSPPQANDTAPHRNALRTRQGTTEQLLATIEALPPGQLAPSLGAHAARYRARLATQDGEKAKAERGFATAASTFREYAMPSYLAVTLTEHGEWLTSQGQSEEAQPLLAEGRETFERLDAKPWLERLEAVATSAPATLTA